MTTTKINRRTALLGTVTLPAAMAPLGMATAEIAQLDAEPDPFVSAFLRWDKAESAYVRACDETASLPIEEHEKRVDGLCDAAADAMLEMAETVPTTTLGLYLAICALLPVFGELVGGGRNFYSFDDMTVSMRGNGSDEALLRSLRTAAERILNGNDEA